jgi:hypothetical protein
MRTLGLLAVICWAIAGCSQTASGKSCIEQANDNFDRCLTKQGQQCVEKRVNEMKLCKGR